MPYLIIITILVIAAMIFFIKGIKPNYQSLDQKQITQTEKPVIMLIIDSLMYKPLIEAEKNGHIPALQFLMEQGQLYPNVVSSYPTMSVTIDSTLLTGTYSDKHRVPGLVWYDEKEKRLINYGSAKEEVFKLGIKHVAEDTFYHLNHTHLSYDTKTVHETLAMKGLQSASVNALVYRGYEKRTLNLPKIGSTLNIAPKNLRVETPVFFSYGMLAQYSPNNDQNNGPLGRFGFNDKFSAQELKYIIQNDKLPAFTIAYFPELDKEVHKKGPENHIDAIERMDKQLQEILNAYPSWEEALNSAIWIIMGDSGQAEVGNDKSKSLIRLNKMLDQYTIYKVNKPVKDNDQIVLGHNERMAFIYILDEHITPEEVVKKLQEDERIGFLAWKDEFDVLVAASGHNNIFTFRPNGHFVDQYGQSWEIKGDPSILDLSINDNVIEFRTYPDALQRLNSALHSHSGNYIIADAKPGFEFQGEGTPIHPGGAAHGSLHEQDSLIPIIVTGTEKQPIHMRMVDLYQWILDLTVKQ
ncbi:alkaline phosphatase family protein [Lederbergia citri]|uniref:Alkaline phosphatase family protein n=1 Tax=Lederbergia citri TaxID=2833580 RepID=A0A942TFC2_9BACI|nr:alkaline phosphatase family protein [Lederbergia citri]MBS4196658.1 alkaline phosphatase family protein [Lederbergia citri]